MQHGEIQVRTRKFNFIEKQGLNDSENRKLSK